MSRNGRDVLIKVPTNRKVGDNYDAMDISKPRTDLFILVQLVQLLGYAHRRPKLHHSPRPEAVAAEVVEPDGNDRDVNPVLFQCTECDHCHPRLRERGKRRIRTKETWTMRMRDDVYFHLFEGSVLLLYTVLAASASQPRGVLPDL